MKENIRMQQLVVGQISTNCYLIQNEDTKELIIVDPGDEAQRIERSIEKMHGIPVAIILTHGHFDHILAVNGLRKYFPSVKLYIGESEKEMLENPVLNCSEDGPSYQINADVWVKEGDVLKLAGFEITVISTPGHTAGSVCYYFKNEGILLSGDTLFNESYGRTDLPTGSEPAMQESLRKLLTTLPENVRVFPGHEEETTIGHEKEYEGFN